MAHTLTHEYGCANPQCATAACLERFCAYERARSGPGASPLSPPHAPRYSHGQHDDGEQHHAAERKHQREAGEGAQGQAPEGQGNTSARRQVSELTQRRLQALELKQRWNTQRWI